MLFELEERLGMRILETLYEDNIAAGQRPTDRSQEAETKTLENEDQAAVSPLTRSGNPKERND